MFDAYFSPPHFHADDAVRMAEFGVSSCLLVLPTGHHAVDEAEVLEKVSPHLVREQVVHHLEAAGIRVFLADGVSPHVEPERAWHHEWAHVRAQVLAGDVHALGELVVRDGSHRALRMVDAHIELAREAQVPLLVAHTPHLEPRWQAALQERAQSLPKLWHWTRVSPAFALEALSDGQRVIAAVSGRDFPRRDLAWLLGELTPEQVSRLAIGSSRGRGLNPFALAASEMLFDEQGWGGLRGSLLEQPTLLGLLDARPLDVASGGAVGTCCVGFSPL